MGRMERVSLGLTDGALRVAGPSGLVMDVSAEMVTAGVTTRRVTTPFMAEARGHRQEAGWTTMLPRRGLGGPV
jgi:hypothetical protein